MTKKKIKSIVDKKQKPQVVVMMGTGFNTGKVFLGDIEIPNLTEISLSVKAEEFTEITVKFIALNCEVIVDKDEEIVKAEDAKLTIKE